MFEEEINKIYYQLLQGRRDEWDRHGKHVSVTGHEYPEPTEHERTRYMIKAAAIFVAGKVFASGKMK